jgi:small subunit ribosomal protein S15
MSLTKEQIEQVTKEYGANQADTGSTPVQVALLTTRINGLVGHLKAHKHDHSTRHGLLKMVGQRRRLLGYLRKTNPAGYQELIKRLGLRR